MCAPTDRHVGLVHSCLMGNVATSGLVGGGTAAPGAITSAPTTAAAAPVSGGSSSSSAPGAPRFTPSDGFFLTDAARTGNTEVLRLFLRKNPALVYAVAGDGSTAWHLSAEQGNAAVLQLLISTTKEAAMSNTFSPLAKVINQPNARGQTALMLGCRAGHVSVVELLLAHGAQLFVADQDGCTALHHAALAAGEADGRVAQAGPSSAANSGTSGSSAAGACAAAVVIQHLVHRAHQDAPAPAAAQAAITK